MKKHLYIGFLLVSFSLLGQKNAEQYLNDLCAPNFHGRGYYKKGDLKAATYISEQFQNIGLKTLPGKPSYFQKFNLDVNTFPGNSKLCLNGNSLVPGEDFIINAKSPKIKGDFDLLELDVNRIDDQNYVGETMSQLTATSAFKIVMPNTQNRDTIIAYHQVVNELSSIRPVLFFHDSKFTWSVGRSVLKNAIFEIKKTYSNATKTSIDFNQKFVKNYESQNVIGYLPAQTSGAETIVVCGHYDHLGRMGKSTYFPGANDNASGIAMILSVAENFKKNPIDKNIIFIAFGAEEAGLVGSTYFVNNPLFPLDSIDFVLNIDIMGSGDKGITMVNANDQKAAFDKMTHINDSHQHILEIKKRGQTKNSDHYPFSSKNVDAVFIYTQGNNSNYHDIYDLPKDVSMESFKKVYSLFIDFIRTYP